MKSTESQVPLHPAAGYLAEVREQTVDDWDRDYDRGEVEREAWERDVRREPWKWHHLVRRTILDHPAEKHVLRCLADHAWAGPDLEGRGRRDGECVLLLRTIGRETGLPARTIKRALAGLEAKGIIVRESRGRRGGGRGANLYRILARNPFEEDEPEQRGQGGPNKGAWVARDLVQ